MTPEERAKVLAVIYGFDASEIAAIAAAIREAEAAAVEPGKEAIAHFMRLVTADPDVEAGDEFTVEAVTKWFNDTESHFDGIRGREASSVQRARAEAFEEAARIVEAIVSERRYQLSGFAPIVPPSMQAGHWSLHGKLSEAERILEAIRAAAKKEG